MTDSERPSPGNRLGGGEPLFPTRAAEAPTAVDIDAAAFLDDDTVAEPRVIDWDNLTQADYKDVMSALADWVDWFSTTYQIPATVLPPCWPEHPGLREDLGHLWTGWLTTRHPRLGVGMIGLDWDNRREQALPRLRGQVALAGCTRGRHIRLPGPCVTPPGEPSRRTPPSR